MKRTWKTYLRIAFLLSLLAPYTSAFALEDGDVLVRAGDTVVTVGEFKTHLAQISGTSQIPLRDTEKKRQFLDFLIDSKLFALEARKEGLDRDPKINAKIREATDRILAKEYVRKNIPGDVQVTDEEAKAYYDKNIDKFTRQERVLVRQIVLKGKEEAEAVLAQLKGGADFEKLARERSTDVTAKSGGLVGWLRKGKLPKDVEEIAYSMKEGEICDIISSGGRYHILKVENRQEEKLIPFEQTKSVVKAKAAEDKRIQILEDFRTRLRNKYNVEINTEVVNEVIEK